jgi:hypothetical protein
MTKKSAERQNTRDWAFSAPFSLENALSGEKKKCKRVE